MAMVMVHVHLSLKGEDFIILAESIAEVAITGMRSVIESTTIKGSYQNIHRRHQQAVTTLGKIAACLTDEQQEELDLVLSLVKKSQAKYLQQRHGNRKDKKIGIAKYRDATIDFEDQVQMTSDAVAGDISVRGKNSAAYQLYVKCKEKSIDCEELVEKINSTNSIKSKKAKRGMEAKPKKPSKGEVQKDSGKRKQNIERTAEELTSHIANYINQLD